jgi:DNA-binding FadR family transcriptional regulator
VVDRQSDRALYMQIADLLRGEIRSGRFAPGGKLPSESGIMQTYDVGRPAVRHALAVLRSEGLIVTERGKPSRVREQFPRKAIKLKRGDVATARMPGDDERRELQLDRGVPIIDVKHTDGTVDRYGADEYEITA